MTTPYASSRRILLPLVLLCFPVYAAVVKDPESCASRPCVYTIRCASEKCTSEEVAQVQSSIDDAQPGDTIQAEAGKTFPITGVYGLMLKHKTGVAGERITITTTEVAQLPDPGDSHNAGVRAAAANPHGVAGAVCSHDDREWSLPGRRLQARWTQIHQ